MLSIRTVNIVWERKVRGSYPISPYALGNDGSVVLALPRPLEPRAYDLTRLALDETARSHAGFSVETLLKLEASRSADVAIGLTSDDLYLLSRGAKSRLLSERHILFVDAAMSADGQVIAAGYSDLAASSFALVRGEISGRIAWMMESAAPISAVAISPDGAWIAQGEETGRITLYDAGRRELWIFNQEQPVRALACAEDGRCAVYGTSAGAVGLIDANGTRKWEMQLPGEVYALSLSADGSLCAALCRPVPGEGAARIYCLTGAGQPAWEYETERRLMRIAVSPDGCFLGASGRDGTHTIYQIIYGAAGGDSLTLPLDETIQRAEQAVGADDIETASRLFQDLLREHPAEAAVCERLLDLQRGWSERFLREAQEHSEHGDNERALAAAERFHALLPDSPQATAALTEYRAVWERSQILQAQGCLDRGDFDASETLLRETIARIPLSLNARRLLARVQDKRAENADADARRLLREGRFSESLSRLEQAQEIAPAPERAESIRSAQTAMEFAEGMAAYNDKNYKLAIFQFKKVLSRDAGHPEARRYLAFAQRFDQDDNEALNDRFGRLE